MKYSFLMVLLLTLFQFSAIGQSQYENTSKYIEINGTNEQYSGAIDQLLILLKKEYAQNNISESKWEQVKSLKAEALKDIKRRLVSAYESYFTELEINQMYAFYQTDAGKQMAVNRNALTKEQLTAVKTFYTTAVGQKIQENSDALGKTIGDISTEWSHLLFLEAKNILE